MLTLYEMKKRKREEPEADPEVADDIVDSVESTYERPHRVLKRMRCALKNKRINLQHLFLTEKDMRTFVVPFLKKNPDITEVDLRGNFIGDKAAEVVLEVSTIIELDLSVNEITDELAMILSKNRNIKILNLSTNNITDIGAVALSNNKTLDDLDLDTNNIGNTGLRAFADNDTLKALDVKCNPKIEPSHLVTFLSDIESARKKDFQDRKAAFLMGTDPRLGKNSAIHYAFSKSAIFDKNLIDEIFKFISPKEFRYRY